MFWELLKTLQRIHVLVASQKYSPQLECLLSGYATVSLVSADPERSPRKVSNAFIDTSTLANVIVPDS